MHVPIQDCNVRPHFALEVGQSKYYGGWFLLMEQCIFSVNSLVIHGNVGRSENESLN